MVWREVSSEFVVGASLFVGHRESLGCFQALFPCRHGVSLSAKVVCGQALVEPGAWLGRRERSSESPEGGAGLLCWPCCRMVSGHPEVQVDLGDTGVPLQGIGGGGPGLRDQAGRAVGRVLGLLSVLAAQVRQCQDPVDDDLVGS